MSVNSTLPGTAARTEIITVTPELAEQWLTRNTRNRHLRKSLFNNYARNMAAGRWVMNGETLKFDTAGNLLDGQHRLKAITVAGQSVDMLVVTGLDPRAQDTMDVGAKRTMADALTLHDEKNATVLAAVLRKIWLWNLGDHRFNSGVNPSITECADLLAERPEIRRSVDVAQQVHHHFPVFPQSVTGTAHHIFTGIEPAEATWFFGRLGDGANLSTGSPLLSLRNRVLAERADRRRIAPYLRMAYLIRTWNAVREDRPLARIQQGPDDPMPMPK